MVKWVFSILQNTWKYSVYADNRKLDIKFGYKAYNPLENVAKENCNEVYVIGSAVKAGNALTAIQDGYQAGLKL